MKNCFAYSIHNENEFVLAKGFRETPRAAHSDTFVTVGDTLTRSVNEELCCVPRSRFLKLRSLGISAPTGRCYVSPGQATNGSAVLGSESCRL